MGFFNRHRKNAERSAGSRPGSSLSSNESINVLLFSPHQDDELLTMGIFAANIREGDMKSAGLCAERERGGDVTLHVTLCTDGSSSAVFPLLSNGSECPLHEGAHLFELSESEFVDGRDREFLDSCRALGYRPSEIHFPYVRAKDKFLDVETSKRIISSALRSHPEARVCTFYPLEAEFQHSDHRNLGRAALELFEEGKITELDLYVEPYLIGKLSDAGMLDRLSLEEMKPGSDSASSRLDRAMDAYAAWDPSAGRFAIGRHSVTTEFSDFRRDKTAYHRLLRR